MPLPRAQILADVKLAVQSALPCPADLKRSGGRRKDGCAEVGAARGRKESSPAVFAPQTADVVDARIPQRARIGHGRQVRVMQFVQPVDEACHAEVLPLRRADKDIKGKDLFLARRKGEKGFIRRRQRIGVRIGIRRFNIGIIQMMIEAAVRILGERHRGDQRGLIRVRGKQRDDAGRILGERAGRDAGAVVGEDPGLAVLCKAVRIVAAARIAVVIHAGNHIMIPDKGVPQRRPQLYAAVAVRGVAHAARDAAKSAAEVRRALPHGKAMSYICTVRRRGKRQHFTAVRAHGRGQQRGKRRTVCVGQPKVRAALSENQHLYLRSVLAKTIVCAKTICLFFSFIMRFGA